MNERRPPPETVTLRPVVAADLPTIYEHQADPESVRMAAVFSRDREAFFAHWTGVLANPSVTVRAILADGEFAGHVSYFNKDGLDSIGYWIDRAHWNRGIATRGLALFLKEIKVRPLHASAARTNGASLRVLERCGFRVTGHEFSPATERYRACETTSLRLD